jgi:hypothetical protein
MAVITVMRGKPKDGCHHSHSNKHYANHGVTCKIQYYHQNPPEADLGWEFHFLDPNSGTPIGSKIPVSFLILKIPVGFCF